MFCQAGKDFLGMPGLAGDVYMLGEGHVERSCSKARPS